VRVERRIAGSVAVVVAAVAVAGFWVFLLLDRPNASSTSSSAASSFSSGAGVVDAEISVLAGSAAFVTSSAGQSVSYVMTAGRLLGRVVDVRPERGSGFVAPGALSFRYRVDEVVVESPKVVVLDAGTDDVARDPTAAQARAAASATVETVKERLPRAKVVIVGPLVSSTGVSKSALAVRDGLRSAAREAHVGFVDPIAERWITADNSAQMLARGALTTTGHAYVGLQLANALDRLGFAKP
jgi:hypothetical protein